MSVSTVRCTLIDSFIDSPSYWTDQIFMLGNVLGAWGWGRKLINKCYIPHSINAVKKCEKWSRVRGCVTRVDRHVVVFFFFKDRSLQESVMRRDLEVRALSIVNIQGWHRIGRSFKKGRLLLQVERAGVESFQTGADQGGYWINGVSGLPSAGGRPAPDATQHQGRSEL